MRVIDLQVSYQALPEQARIQGMEMAAGAYKQMAALAQARQENLSRPEKVMQAAQTSSSAMSAVDLRERRIAQPLTRPRDAKEPESFLYTERGVKRMPVQSVGKNLDLFI